MLKGLILHNFQSGFDLAPYDLGECFVMPTCQRTLVLSYNNNPFKKSGHELANTHLESTKAYEYLLEIICGLQSKLIGENEIKNQFKVAFKDYLENSPKSSLTVIIEKLFTDAKKIRSQYLTGLSQKTYSSIARKKMFKNSEVKTVLILGSGNLALDLINQFKKKCEVIICARNKNKVQQLVSEHLNVAAMDWEFLDQFTNFPYIINTIGTNEELISKSQIKDWESKNKKKHFIDLSAPCIYKFDYKTKEHLTDLEDIMQAGAIAQDLKNSQIEQAKKALSELAQRRCQLLHVKKVKSINKIAGAYV